MKLTARLWILKETENSCAIAGGLKEYSGQPYFHPTALTQYTLTKQFNYNRKV